MTPLQRIKDINKICVTTEDSLNNFLEDIKQWGYVAVDTETSSLDIVELSLAGASFYGGGKNAYYFPAHHKTNEEQLPEEVFLTNIKNVLQDKNRLCLERNLRYDI